MSQTYQTRRRTGTAPAAKEIQTGVTGPSIQELAAGAAPTTEQMGSRVDLPGAIREKMESSFGADFSNVKLYESRTVADAGAEAMTQGNNIAFAPGKLDLTSTSGQALLGHELSHVVSQARGESAGQGFLNDAHLEAQADRQGMMAAQGESVYSGSVTPVGASSAVSASGPMQASKKSDIADKALKKPSEEQINNMYNPDALMYPEPEESTEPDAITNAIETYSQNSGANGGEELSTDYIERQLTRGNYYDYLAYAMENTKNARKQQDLLKLFLGDDEDAINAHLRKEANAVTKSMRKNSRGLISSSFRRRANAYTEAEEVKRRFDAINSTNLGDVLSDEECNAMDEAESNFNADRDKAYDSLQAHASFGWSFIREGLNDKKQIDERKAYRKARRGGDSAQKIREDLENAEIKRQMAEREKRNGA